MSHLITPAPSDSSKSGMSHCGKSPSSLTVLRREGLRRKRRSIEEMNQGCTNWEIRKVSYVPGQINCIRKRFSPETDPGTEGHSTVRPLLQVTLKKGPDKVFEQILSITQLLESIRALSLTLIFLFSYVLATDDYVLAVNTASRNG